MGEASEESQLSQAVYAMCGLAFSGKSTMARKLAQSLGAALVSLDAINEERGLDGSKGLTDRQWEESSFMAMDRLRGVLRQGRSAVVDDTFPHRFLRDRCKAVAESEGCRFMILFVDTPPSVIEARRADNLRRPIRAHLAEEVFAHHRDRFQFPTEDEAVVRIGSDQDLARFLEAEKPGRA